MIKFFESSFKKEIKKGEIVFKENDVALTAYIIIKGEFIVLFFIKNKKINFSLIFFTYF